MLSCCHVYEKTNLLILKSIKENRSCARKRWWYLIVVYKASFTMEISLDSVILICLWICLFLSNIILAGRINDGVWTTQVNSPSLMFLLRFYDVPVILFVLSDITLHILKESAMEKHIIGLPTSMLNVLSWLWFCLIFSCINRCWNKLRE